MERVTSSKIVESNDLTPKIVIFSAFLSCLGKMIISKIQELYPEKFHKNPHLISNYLFCGFWVYIQYLSDDENFTVNFDKINTESVLISLD